MSSIPLSNEKISFTASLQEGWSGGQGSGDKSRAVKPDFPGLAREQKVLTTDEAFSKPLYLHPIETVNKTQKNLGPTTRGTMNESTVVDNFGVSANYIPKKDGVEQFLFQNEKATKEGSNWFVAGNKTWPLDGSVSFYAYAPYNDPSLQWKGDDKVAQNKTIHYKVPENVKEQPDFIVAKSKDKSFTSSSANTPVDLQFSHALTAITFSVSDDMEKGKINSITIEGVKGEGDYDLSDNKSDNKWDLSKSTATGSYTVSFDGEEGKVEGQRALTGGANDNKVLMMIPQTLGDGAKVTINITPTDKSAVNLTFDLKDTQWVAGNHVTYLLSTTKIIKLNMGSVTYPHWQTAKGAAFTSEKLKSKYVSGDSIGMYVVDKYNKVIEENLKFTYDGSQWTVAGKEFKGSPQYNYFVYYPYQEGGLPDAPTKDTPKIDVTSAASFFDKAIKAWCNKFDTSSGKTIDQSDIAKMNSFDLQIGKADVLGESGTTINFTSMTHAMGLSNIILGKAAINGITYETTNNFGPSIKPYIWGGDIIYASAKVIGYKLFKISDYEYVSIVKSTGITVLNTADDDKDGWKNSLSFSPKANCVLSQTAINKRKDEKSKLIDYEIKLGDIYYNDGSISHDLDETITDKHYPVGIIVYLAKDNGVDGKLDYWVETNTKNADVGGHALVMCLKTVGSNATSDLGETFAWSTITNCGRTKYCDPPTIEGSGSYIYGSGYLETEALDKLGKCPAASAAKHYDGLKVSNKSTGWFLPTVGQYLAAIEQLGGGKPLSWNINATFTNSTSIIKNINDALSKVGANKYTYFCQTAAYAWTSTEHPSPGNANYIYTSGASSILIGTALGAQNYRQQLRVRPFLAF